MPPDAIESLTERPSLAARERVLLCNGLEQVMQQPAMHHRFHELSSIVVVLVPLVSGMLIRRLRALPDFRFLPRHSPSGECTTACCADTMHALKSRPHTRLPSPALATAPPPRSLPPPLPHCRRAQIGSSRVADPDWCCFAALLLDPSLFDFILHNGYYQPQGLLRSEGRATARRPMPHKRAAAAPICPIGQRQQQAIMC